MSQDSLSTVLLEISPVGVVHSPIKEPVLSARDSGLELRERMDKVRSACREIQDTVSELEIFEPWQELLDGIEGFSHILILYWPHLIDPERRKLKKVHPMGRSDLPEQGIFATCSPARPNPILVTATALIKREKNRLHVQGLEAVDGSPLIDIKPYSTHYCMRESVRVPDWMNSIQQGLDEE